MLLPLFVDLSGKDVLVVGGGPIAARKIAELVDAGASVHVVAKDVTPDLETLAASGDVTWTERAFEEHDVDGSWLIVAATDRPDVQKHVSLAAERARVFCVAVDDPRNASAYGGACLHRDPITIAISTAGEAPALARLMREVLEACLPEASWIASARELRARWKREKTPMERRFPELVRALYARAVAEHDEPGAR